MKRVSLALAVMILTFTGCQDRRFVNVGKVGPGGNEVGIPAESVENFAKQQGISKSEAIEYLRDGQTRSGDSSHEAASDPPASGGILDTGEESSGEATATDSTSTSQLNSPSRTDSSPVRTAGGSSKSRF